MIDPQRARRSLRDDLANLVAWYRVDDFDTDAGVRGTLATGDFDQVLSLTGEEYARSPIKDAEPRGNLLTISGTGTIDGAAWQHSRDYISTAFAVGFDFTGGMIDIYRVGTSFMLLDATDEFVPPCPSPL